eukprot:m.333864 g.333864  ORF g.333864 m.333864 type:complete len:420 (-) comp17234_c0_seq1:185-1444(-)
MFAPKFNGTKLKVNLKLCITRLQMLQRKKENQGVLSRKDIAALLEKGKHELARIRVEQIIREDFIVEVLEILELYCSLLVSRFGLIEAVKNCDPGIKEAAATLMWATPHLDAEVKELRAISQALSLRYGKEFIQEVMTDASRSAGTAIGPDAVPKRQWVSERVIVKLTTHRYEDRLVDSYLVAIAQSFGVTYNPPLRMPEGDLLGGSVPSAPTIFDFPEAPSTNGNYNSHNNNNNSGGGGGGGGVNLDLLLPSPPRDQQPSAYPPQAQNTYPPQQPHNPNLYPPPSNNGQNALYPPEKPNMDSFPSAPQSQNNGPPTALDLQFPSPPTQNNDLPPSFEESMRMSGPPSTNVGPPPPNPTSSAPLPFPSPAPDLSNLPAPPNDSIDMHSLGSVQPGGGSVEPDFDELTRRFKELRQKSED